MTHVADVTIQSSQVPADLTDFRVLIDLSDLPAAFWSTVANGGGDIRCFKSDGTTELAREVVSCDTATDTGELYIKFAGTLSSTVDTTIQIHADGTSSDYAVTATYGRNAVWSDYDVVLHLENGINSTGGSNGVGANIFTSSGYIGGGFDFNGTDSRIDVPLSSLAEPFSLQAWGALDFLSEKCILSVANDGVSDSQHRLFHNVSNKAEASSFDGTLSAAAASSGLSTTSTWGKLDGVWASASSRTAYFNGANSGTNTDTRAVTLIDRLTLGVTADSTPLAFWNGQIDEVRLRPSALSADWISTEYNNQSSPSTFYTASAVNTHVADVVIDNTKVSADLTDFVVYVDLSDLPTTGFWDTVANGGGDIRCFKSDGTTELAREVVSCDTATDTGELHIRFAGTLSSSVDTTIEIHADGTSSDYAVTATYGRNAVWSDYAAVYHGNNTTDATGGGSDVTLGDSYSGVSGAIGEAFNIATSEDHHTKTAPFSVATTDPISIQLVVNRDANNATDNFNEVYFALKDNLFADGFEVGLDSSQRLTTWTTGGNTNSRVGGSVLSLNTDYWLSVVNDQPNSTIGHFVDGDSDGLVTSYSDTSSTPVNGRLVIGDAANLGRDGLDGQLSELRIRISALSDDWIATEYNNQSSPSTFYTASAVSTSTITGSGVVQSLGQQFATQVASRLGGWIQ